MILFSFLKRHINCRFLTQVNRFQIILSFCISVVILLRRASHPCSSLIKMKENWIKGLLRSIQAYPIEINCMSRSSQKFVPLRLLDTTRFPTESPWTLYFFPLWLSFTSEITDSCTISVLNFFFFSFALTKCDAISIQCYSHKSAVFKGYGLFFIWSGYASRCV